VGVVRIIAIALTGGRSRLTNTGQIAGIASGLCWGVHLARSDVAWEGLGRRWDVAWEGLGRRWDVAWEGLGRRIIGIALR